MDQSYLREPCVSVGNQYVSPSAQLLGPLTDLYLQLHKLVQVSESGTAFLFAELGDGDPDDYSKWLVRPLK